MASETDSLLIPFILGLTAAGPLQDSPNPPQETQEPATPRDRIILVNPSTQTMAVFETNINASLGLAGSLFGDYFFSRKSGQRPASKSSIDNLPRVETAKGEKDDDDEQYCVVCLEEYWEGTGDDEIIAKEMPCKHRFHGECIEKWLKINGCCPVCRYQMPVDDEDDNLGNKSSRDQNEGERRREIWVSFSFGGL